MAEDPISLSPVIVTGGCGFTDSHLVSGLLESEQDCQIHVIAHNARNEIAGVTYHKCDISAPAEVQVSQSWSHRSYLMRCGRLLGQRLMRTPRKVSGVRKCNFLLKNSKNSDCKSLTQAVFERVKPKTVFHVACPSSTVSQPATFRRVNVGGAYSLLAAATSVKIVQAFVFTSSASVSQTNTKDAINIHEADPILWYPAQKHVYSLTKAEAEVLVLAANRANGDSSMLTVSIRPAGVFGERDAHCAGKIIAAARQGKAGYQFGSGKNMYDFVYVSNLVDAHVRAARALIRSYGEPPPGRETRVDGETLQHHKRRTSTILGVPTGSCGICRSSSQEERYQDHTVLARIRYSCYQRVGYLVFHFWQQAADGDT